MANSKLVDLTELAAANLTGADWLLTYDTSQGVTKKLAPSVLKDLLKLTYAQGDILYHDGGNIVKLAKGTAGQTLAMNSGATAPEWSTATTGWEFVEDSYDFSVDGAVTSFETATFEDGYEYALQIYELSGEVGDSFTVEWYKANAAAYHSNAVVFVASQDADGDDAYAWIETRFARLNTQIKWISVVASEDANLNLSGDGARTIDGSASELVEDTVYTTGANDKMGKLRISNTISSFDAGVCQLWRRAV